MAEIQKNDVVQFNEKHEWCASLGFISNVKEVDGNYKYMVGVPIPQRGIAYIFADASEIEYIGRAVLVDSVGEDE